MLEYTVGAYRFSALLYEPAGLQANNWLLMLNMFALRRASLVCFGVALHLRAAGCRWQHVHLELTRYKRSSKATGSVV